jgi:NodT family efflux transporter outer membrane factor (OMF) lipoprotein
MSFGDPMLDELVATADRRNLDLRIAVSRIREARAMHGIAAADLFPEIGAKGDAYAFDGSRTSAGTFSAPDRYYTASLDLAWEIDLWGRVRRSIEAATYEVETAVEDARDLLVSIRAEVARSYIEVRSLQAQVRALDDTIASRRETLELVESRRRQGAATDLDVAQAVAQLAAAAAERPAIVGELASACDRISVLLGESAGPMRETLAASFDPERPVPVPPVSIAIGIPADTIRHRADVRAAERTLLAATARIGVAEASLLPAIRISGEGGFSSTSFDNLLDRNALGGMLGLDISWPIFTAGRLQEVVRVRDEQADQALFVWERTVLEAIAEVESALIAYAATIEERERLQDTVAAYRRSSELARARYDAGVNDLQIVLDIEREWLVASQRLAQVEGQVASNAVGLYKALGGAWEIDDPRAAAADRSDPGRMPDPIPLKASQQAPHTTADQTADSTEEFRG